MNLNGRFFLVLLFILYTTNTFALISADFLGSYSSTQESSVQNLGTNLGGEAKMSKLSLQTQIHLGFLPFIEFGALAQIQQSSSNATLYNGTTSSQVSGKIDELWIGPSVRLRFANFFLSLSPLLYGSKKDDRFPSVFAEDSASANLRVKPFQSYIASAGLSANFIYTAYITLQIQYHYINYDSSLTGDNAWINDAIQVRSIKPYVGLRIEF